MTQTNIFGSIVSNWIAAIEFDAIRKAEQVKKHQDLLGRKRSHAYEARNQSTKAKAKELESMMEEGECDDY